MTDLPEAVKRALDFYGNTAADLALAGGVLRCGTCKAEQPITAERIASYLRHGWPQHCGLTMTWVTLKELAREGWGKLAGGRELVAEPAANWRLDAGRRCRRRLAGQRLACGKQSAAVLNRGMSLRATSYRPARTADSLWGYCLEHMGDYRHWIEDGKVMSWVLREADGA